MKTWMCYFLMHNGVLIIQDSRGLSFTTISGFGSNGAIIHYSPTPQTDKNIDR